MNITTYKLSIAVILILICQGCTSSQKKTDGPVAVEREDVTYGKSSKQAQEFWKDKNGYHYLAVAHDQKTLNGGKRVAQVMANRGIAEAIQLKIRSEVAIGTDDAGAQFMSDVVAQVTQQVLNGVTPEKSWHKKGQRSDGVIYECYSQVVISEADFKSAIDQAKGHIRKKAPNSEIKAKALEALSKIQ